MAKSKFNFHKINRRIHLYAGLVTIPYIFIFGLSGLMFNHSAFLGHNRSVQYFQLNGENSFDNLFPNIESLANIITDSIKTKRKTPGFQLNNIKYNNTMIIRNANKEADHRVQIDIPTNNVQIMTLPPEITI